MIQINSRADLDELRDTASFMPAMEGIYGSIFGWNLADYAWEMTEDNSVLDRLGFTRAEFLLEIDAFQFSLPAPPPTPLSTLPTTLPEAIAAKLSEVAEKRLVVETGGMMFGQIPIPTDRQTAGIITSAYIKATANPAYVVENWKVTDALFVTLDAATIIALGDAVSAHVQASFNRNAALSLAVQALDTVEAVNAFDVDVEW